MYCPYCGEANEEGYIYCDKCGRKLPSSPGKEQGAPLPPTYEPWQARKTVRIPTTGIVAGVLVLAFVAMIGWIIFGRDRSEPGADVSGSRESATAEVGMGFQQSESAAEGVPFSGQENRSQQPTNEAAGAVSGRGQQGLVGEVWQLALVSSEQIQDYGGELPAEGHIFHRLELLAVNTGDVPASSFTGSYTAEWQGNTYSQLEVRQLQGNIPPGWPLKIEVFFDLPAIVRDPAFKLQISSKNAAERTPVDLNTLGAQLKYKPIQLAEYDKTFLVPGKIAIKPTGMRRLISQVTDRPFEYLALDASVGNLSGYDLNLPREVLNTGLSFQMITPGNIYPLRQYQWTSPAAATADELDKNRYGANPPPIPPGYTHDGTFYVRNTDINATFTKALLLVQMFNDWALYPLDEDSAALVQSPLAPIDPLQSVLQYAQQAIQEDKWMQAASMFAILYKAHPGNPDYVKALTEIQEHTGKWIFSPASYDLNPSAGNPLFTYARLPWAVDEAASVLYESTFPAVEGDTIGQPLFSPDGARLVLLSRTENGYHATIANLSSSGAPAEVSLPLDSTKGEYLDGKVYNWSNNGRYLLLPFKAAETSKLSIVLLDLEKSNVLRYDTCAVIEGVAAIAWSPDGASVTYADQGASQLGIAPLVGEGCRTFPSGVEYTGFVSNLIWSADDRLYVILDDKLRMFSLDGSNLKEQRFDAVGSRIYLSPDQRYLTAARDWNPNTIVYDTQSGEAYLFEPSQRTLIGWMP